MRAQSLPEGAAACDPGLPCFDDLEVLYDAPAVFGVRFGYLGGSEGTPSLVVGSSDGIDRLKFSGSGLDSSKLTPWAIGDFTLADVDADGADEIVATDRIEFIRVFDIGPDAEVSESEYQVTRKLDVGMVPVDGVAAGTAIAWIEELGEGLPTLAVVDFTTVNGMARLAEHAVEPGRYGSPRILGSEDLDSDGHDDVLLSNGAELSIAYGTPTGVDPPVAVNGSQSLAYSADFIDIDGNGSVDIVVSDATSGRVDGFMQVGARSFERDEIEAVSCDAYAAGSFRLAGPAPALVIASARFQFEGVSRGANGLNVLFPHEGFWRRSVFELDWPPRDWVLGDLDGDGREDAILALEDFSFGGRVAWMRNTSR